MRLRKYTVLLLGTTITYIVVCVYLLGSIDSLKDNVSRIVTEKGQDPEQMNLVHQIVKSECTCRKSESPTGHSPTPHNSDVIDIQTVSISKQTCDLMHAISSKTAVDIQVSDVYSHLQLQYHHLTFTHRGWIPDFQDLSYSSSQWSQDPLNIYIIPFSHQDPGWLSTVDQYYSDKTKKTLDFVLEKLTSEADLTFAWSEVIYLYKWYNELEQNHQHRFRMLLASQRFEVVTGGWVMTDEAVTHYSAMLDQLIMGHQWLHKTFNYTVQSAWSLDAFGASSTIPYFLSQSGIKKLLIQRVHYNLKGFLGRNKQLQFIWRQHWDMNGSTDVFTHLPPFRLYNILHSCGPDPEVCCQFDFVKKNCFLEGDYYKPEKITDSNVHEKSLLLLDQLRKKAQLFRHNNLLMLYGDDFRYHSQDEWASLHDNLKKLMEHMNSQQEMHIKMKFSTLNDYLKVAQSSLQTQTGHVPRLSGDFLSYNDRDEQYWTGYYTSRPLLKYMARRLYHSLRSADILSALVVMQTHGHSERVSAQLRHQLSDKLEEVHGASGLLQHHDAITGTARRAVVRDYLRRLKNALTIADGIAAKAISFMMMENVNYDQPFPLDAFTSVNIQESEQSPLTQKLIKLTDGSATVAVFNPLSTERSAHVTMTVNSPHVVVEYMSRFLSCQVAPVWNSDHIISDRRYKVTFLVQLAALEVIRYRLKAVEMPDPRRCTLSKVKITSAIHHHDHSSVFDVAWQGVSDIVVETPLLKVNFCGCTGLLQGIITKDNQVFHQSQVKFVTYGTGSWTHPLEDKSGAYTFIPNGPAMNLQVHRPKIFQIAGPVLTEVITVLPMVTHKVTLYNTTGPQGAALFIENVADISAHNNTELAMRLVTDIGSQDLFYTDLNGFQMQKRQRLPQYMIQGNFYPMTSHIYIEDHLFRMSILSTSSHGSSSQKSGEMEVMLDRRLAQDDWRGLSEGVLDNVPTTSQFVFLLETRHTPWKEPLHQKSNQLGHNSLLSHRISLHINHPPQAFMQQKKTHLSSMLYRPIKVGLPCDIHMLNLRLTPSISHSSNPEALLLLHRISTDCDFLSTYEKCHISNGQVVLGELFPTLKIGKVEEMTLTGTQLVHSHDENLHQINLPLMEIKTFRLTIS